MQIYCMKMGYFYMLKEIIQFNFEKIGIEINC